jgi:hypothetical protein
MSKDFLLMLTLSVLVTAISIGGLSYIVIAQPDYLRADRDGVPFYTSQVEHPEGDQPVSLGELIRHFKGE